MGCGRILITGYSFSPVVRSVNTASMNGAVETTWEGFTHPNRKRNLTRSQNKRFSVKAKAGSGQNDGRKVAQPVDATKKHAKESGQNGKCAANLNGCTDTLPGFDATERSSTRASRGTRLIKPSIRF